MTAVLLELKVALDPSLYLLILLDTLAAAIFLLAAGNFGLVLSFTKFLNKLAALGAAVVNDTVAARCAFVNPTSQGCIARDTSVECDERKIQRRVGWLRTKAQYTLRQGMTSQSPMAPSATPSSQDACHT